jgi:ankyrin repeat protein
LGDWVIEKMRGRAWAGPVLAVCAIGLVFETTRLMGAAGDTRVADAAMRGDRDTVRALLKEAADVNGAQGDGMTALHWAAVNDDPETAELLLYAGANVKATTRLGGYTPLWLAAQTGDGRLVSLLLSAGAAADAANSLGVTPLMMAAAQGGTSAIKALASHGADVNAMESLYQQTPLMFAAARNRPDAIRMLVELGAQVEAATRTRTPPARGRRGGAGRGGQTAEGRGRGAADAAASATIGVPGTTDEPKAPPTLDERQQLGLPPERVATEPMGGLTPLLYAARQGHFEAVDALLDTGADLNATSADRTSPLMMAIINGHFDLAMHLLERGADPKVATVAGGTPLYRVVDLQWAPKSFYPQPSTKQEKTSYLDLMKALLAHGADPNARLVKQLWYTGYGFELEGVDPAGATPFWRAAEVADLDALRLLKSAGADPNVPTTEGVTPLLVAAGDGFHGNDAITVPAGRLPAVKFLVEECGADVNAVDVKGGDSTNILHSNSRTYTALHAAAARGDNEMVLYLVSKGARVDLVGTNGVTVADAANSPRERIEPFPETIQLLISLGARNSNRCVSC